MRQLPQLKRLGIQPKKLTINYLLTIRIYQYHDKRKGNRYHAGVAYVNSVLVIVRRMKLEDQYNCYLEVVSSLGIERFESGQHRQGVVCEVIHHKATFKEIKGFKDFIAV